MHRSRTARFVILSSVAVLLLGGALWLRLVSNRGGGSGPPRRPPPERTADQLSLRPWKAPGKAPAPREVLTGDTWSLRYKQALENAGQEAAGSSTGPVFSLRITDVFEGSQARQLGIKAGDHMVTYDGAPILGVQGFDLQRLDRPGTLKLWSAAGGYREVDVHPGRLGVYFAELWRPDRTPSERNPKWDDFLRVAVLTLESDPAVSETALYHAQREGYRGWLTPALLTILSSFQLRHRDALAHGWIAKDRAPKELLKPVLSAFYQSAVMAGAAEAARELSQTFQAYNLPPESWVLGTAVERFRRMTEQDFAGPSPWAIAVGARPIDVEGLEPNGEYIQRMLKSRRACPFHFDPPQGMGSFLGPAVANPAYLLELDLQATREEAGDKFPASAQMALIDISGGADESLIRVELHPRAHVRIAAHGHPDLIFAPPVQLKAKGNTIDLSLRGPWCEVRINGACAFLGPVPHRTDRRVALAYSLWNVKGSLVDLQVKDLGSYPVPPAITASRPTVTPPPKIDAPAKPTDPALAWYHQAMVEGYLRHGSRHPAWDAAAVSALKLGLSHIARPTDLIDIGEIHARATEAFEAGCDDPLLLGLLDSAHRWAKRAPHEDVVPQLRRRVLAGAGAGYSPALRCVLRLQAAGEPQAAAGTRFPGSSAKLYAEVLELLPQAVAEPGVPSSLLTRIMSDLSRGLPEYEKNPLGAFERVRTAGGASPAVKAFEGEFFISQAWKARGGGWAREVTPEGWRLFRERLELARAALEEAWNLDPKHAGVPAAMLKVALGLESARNQAETWLQRGWSADPNSIETGTQALWFLMPRWHGSREQLLAFGRLCLAEAVEKDLSPTVALLLLQAHHNIVYPNSFGSGGEREDEFIEATYWRQSFVWKDVTAVFDWVFSKRPASTYARSAFAYYAARCGRWEDAHAAFEKVGDSLCLAAFPSREEAYKLRAQARAHAK